MKRCIRCGNENRDDYIYCTMCGAELPCVDEKQEWEDAPQTNSAEYGKDGISVYEMNVFVGKNREQIVPKFVAIQKEGRTFWCLPLILLGLFLGYFGMAAWFLYRKMNKAAALVLSFGLAVSLLDILVNIEGQIALYKNCMEVFRVYSENFASNPIAVSEWFTAKIDEITSIYNQSAFVWISRINVYLESLILPLVLGFFGIKIYMKYALKTIAETKAEQGSDTDYILILHRKGGCSVARIFIGLAIFCAASSVISAIPLVAALL